MVESGSSQADGVPKYLMEAGFITADQAGAAATRQKASGERFTSALVLGGSLAGDELFRGLSRRNGEEVIEVDGHSLHPRLLHLIPEPVAFEQKLLPIHRVRNVLFAAVPASWGRAKELPKLEKQLGLHLEPVPVEEADVPGLIVKCHQLLRGRSLRERRIGQALVERGLLAAPQLQQGLALQKQKGGRLGQALVELGFLSESQLFLMLSERLKMPLLDAATLGERLNPSIAKRITQSFAEHNMILPFNQDAAALQVACSYSCDPNVMETLKSVTGARRIDFFLVEEDTLKKVLNSVYSGGIVPAGAAAGGAKDGGGVDLSTEVTVSDVEVDLKDMDTDAFKDTEVPKIINYMLYQAVKKTVSDIHIEQYENRADVKFRIDGQLRPQPQIPITAENCLRVISKLKIDAKLDIAERRKPQDGSFRKRLGEKLIVDFRLAIQPTLFGENAVIRVLDRTAPLPTLHQLGMPEDMLKRYLRSIQNPQGMVIFTGPTGSGKTTTLYCTLEVLRKQALKIITAEDPVEYMFDGIQQCQVQDAIGNTFARYLRGFLRQDPDVILVGEIRDQETGIMATRAAVTGHLLFTTIHATDAVGVIRRIIDMGVDSNMLSMSILTVCYQRLMRRICTSCKSEYREDPAVLEDLGLKELLSDVPLYKGAGCEGCENEGYRGRVAVYEYWEPDDEVKDQISKDPDDRKIRALAFQRGLQPMVVDALAKVRAGITTLAELQEVVPYNQILKAKDFLKKT